MISPQTLQLLQQLSQKNSQTEGAPQLPSAPNPVMMSQDQTKAPSALGYLGKFGDTKNEDGTTHGSMLTNLNQFFMNQRNDAAQTPNMAMPQQQGQNPQQQGGNNALMSTFLKLFL